MHSIVQSTQYHSLVNIITTVCHCDADTTSALPFRWPAIHSTISEPLY